MVVLPEATQHWSLTGLFGGANGRLWEGSRQGVLPRTSAASVLVRTVKQSQPPPLQETLQHQQVGLVQCPPGSLLLPLCPNAHTTPCAPSKSGVSVSPSPVEVLQSIPTRLQNLILYEFLPPLLDPQVGKPDVGLRTFTPVDGLLWYKCLLNLTVDQVLHQRCMTCSVAELLFLPISMYIISHSETSWSKKLGLTLVVAIRWQLGQ